MITLNKIFIYPIKSLGGIEVKEAEITPRGLKYDRRWVLMDEKGELLSQRNYPKLCLLDQKIVEKGIHISEKNNPNNNILIPFTPDRKTEHTIDLWGDLCKGVSVSEKVDAFFSEYLQIPAKLIFQTDDIERVLVKTNAANGHQTSFTDGYPYMILSEASLEDLNERLQAKEVAPLKMNRFRPNFVLKGCEAFEEDTWEEFQIGNIVFQKAKPCVRCQMITIEQETSNRHESGEPLRTLSTYRRWENNGVTFGMNIAAKNLGLIKVKDALSIE